MTNEVQVFLTAGRQFRARVRKGSILLMERNVDLRDHLADWLKSGSGELPIRCRTPQEGLEILRLASSAVRCVVVGLDPSEDPTLIDQIEHGFPGVVVVVYTRDAALADKLTQHHPRVTTVCVRDGLAVFLKDLQTQMGSVLEGAA